MEIEKVVSRIDKLLEENRREEAEKLMRESIAHAVDERDDASLLRLLNELLGFYRETGRHEEAYLIADRAIAHAEEMGLSGTVPYATTLLNAANAYRAGGRLQESLERYLQVREIYRTELAPDDMLAASFLNNLSLLHQEMGEYGQARECLLAALRIVRGKGGGYELGATYANLAATCVQLERPEETREYAGKAIEVFEAAGIRDSHYAAALSAMGAWHFQRGEYRAAGEAYRQAMELVEQCNGRSHAYKRLEENVRVCAAAEAADAEGCGREPQEDRGDSWRAAQECGAACGGREPQEDRGDSWRAAQECGAACGRQEPQEDRGDSWRAAQECGAACGRQEPQEDGEGSGEAGQPCGGCADSSGRQEISSRAGGGIGLRLARAYYEEYGIPMIREHFSEYEGKIAAGLAGRGSDCFGYDDELSRDHDWGPAFCLWVTDETYGEIGAALQEAYEALPAQYRGYRRAPHVNGRNRRGVLKISEFYRSLVGAERYEEIDWRSVSDASLAAAVNGEIFRDDEGIFSAFRDRLLRGYPEDIFYLKLAESGARYAQAAEYNFARVTERGDGLTARMLAWDGIREAMRIQLYLSGKYPPHDKWLHRSLLESEEGKKLSDLLEEIAALLASSAPDQALQEKLTGVGAFLAEELYRRDVISDVDSYLDAHSGELLCKAALAGKSIEALAGEIAGLEFKAFDKVENEGGRAHCQDDWFTFSIMRKSQYLTWDKTMLMQYLYDFRREYERGHNLITEKYGRMMESTAPERYAEISGRFPELTEEKKKIIAEICAIQVQWMEEFAVRYPLLADNARSIHTFEDSAGNTSYETYLKGELGTYSDKMLELYGRYTVRHARGGKNPVYDIMGNSVKMYGYRDLDEAQEKIKAVM